jgi:hypothetical protein
MLVAFELLENELERVEAALRESAAKAIRNGDLDQANSLMTKIRGLQSQRAPIGVCRSRVLEILSDSEAEQTIESDRNPPSEPGLQQDMRWMTYNGTRAYARMSPRGCKVLADSTVRRAKHFSLATPWRRLRDQCEANGVLTPAQHPDLLVLTKDLVFPSPSAAAQFVAGCSVSGPREWMKRPPRLD